MLTIYPYEYLVDAYEMLKELAIETGNYSTNSNACRNIDEKLEYISSLNQGENAEEYYFLERTLDLQLTITIYEMIHTLSYQLHLRNDYSTYAVYYRDRKEWESEQNPPPFFRQFKKP